MAGRAPRLASISIDLDTLPHYCRIHGLDESLLDEHARQLVYSRALERFQEVFGRHRVPATYFAIGQDLSDPLAASALRQAHRSGMEIASHSDSHDYALSRWSKEQILEDLIRAEKAITRATGARPLGFRAPGYTLSPALLEAVRERGYHYDSSAFPAAPYYLAKAAVMGTLQALGRPSRAILDSPRVLLAPTVPYRAHPLRPYQRGSHGVLELPISTSPVSRFPFIGTFALTLPEPMVRALMVSLRRTPHFNFELHGVDLLDASDGIPRELVARQRDLQVPVKTKMHRLERILGWLAVDFDLVTVERAAAHFSAHV